MHHQCLLSEKHETFEGSGEGQRGINPQILEGQGLAIDDWQSPFDESLKRLYFVHTYGKLQRLGHPSFACIILSMKEPLQHH